MPKINGNEIRPGNVLDHNGGLWAAVKVDHVKPGKGGAFAQVELRNLRNGSKLNERFRSADKVERVRLEQKDMQFLYESDGMLVFMDTETFDQFALTADVLGDAAGYLTDGLECRSLLYNGDVLTVELPTTVDLEVVDTAPSIKGATAQAQLKPAELETGLTVQVPPYITVGERIKVDTRDGRYITRV